MAHVRPSQIRMKKEEGKEARGRWTNGSGKGGNKDTKKWERKEATRVAVLCSSQTRLTIKFISLIPLPINTPELIFNMAYFG